MQHEPRSTSKINDHCMRISPIPAKWTIAFVALSQWHQQQQQYHHHRKMCSMTHTTCITGYDACASVYNNLVVCYFEHKIIDLFIKIYSSMCMNCVHVSYDNYWFRVNFGFMFFIWQMTWPKLRLWNMAVARCIDKWKQFEYLGGKCVADGCWNALEENTLTLIHTANEKNCVCEQYQKLFSALITNYY